jgi:hypothetical protein
MPNVAILHVGQLNICIEPFVFGLNLHLLHLASVDSKANHQNNNLPSKTLY